jgi:hypothetical protein
MNAVEHQLIDNALDEHDNDPAYKSLIYAALSETGGNVQHSLLLANTAYQLSDKELASALASSTQGATVNSGVTINSITTSNISTSGVTTNEADEDKVDAAVKATLASLKELGKVLGYKVPVDLDQLRSSIQQSMATGEPTVFDHDDDSSSSDSSSGSSDGGSSSGSSDGSGSGSSDEDSGDQDSDPGEMETGGKASASTPSSPDALEGKHLKGLQSVTNQATEYTPLPRDEVTFNTLDTLNALSSSVTSDILITSSAPGIPATLNAQQRDEQGRFATADDASQAALKATEALPHPLSHYGSAKGYGDNLAGEGSGTPKENKAYSKMGQVIWDNQGGTLSRAQAKAQSAAHSSMNEEPDHAIHSHAEAIAQIDHLRKSAKNEGNKAAVRAYDKAIALHKIAIQEHASTINYSPDQARDKSGKFMKGGGAGGASGGGAAGSGGAAPLTGTRSFTIRDEPTTSPPKGLRAYNPDITEDKNGDGVADAARVGVPGDSVPPPPKIKRLPNLTPQERDVESRFADAYEAHPDKMASNFRSIVLENAAKDNAPPTFGTDDAKVLSGDWSGDHLTLDQRAVNRATYNCALHQTANAICKRAFLQHLDTLKPGDEVTITAGGCAAGKGFALSNIPEMVDIKSRSKAVWDAAGDQNSTENEWLHGELSKRGLKGNYVYVYADPEEQWAHPDRGAVKRAQSPKDGRMITTQVYTDSHVEGPKNFQSFVDNHGDDPNVKVHYIINGATPRISDGMPDKALRIDKAKLHDFVTDVVKGNEGIPSHIKRGALLGERIWPDYDPSKTRKV